MGTFSSYTIEMPEKEIILKKLAQLPGALFESLVFQFDQYNSVPGREAPQLIRATDLFRLLDSRENGILVLWNKICEITTSDDQVVVGLPGNITPIQVDRLLGILIDPNEGDLGEEIARYAFAQVHNTMTNELLRRSDESIVSALVWNLADVPSNEGEYPILLAFAVFCHSHATGLKKYLLEKKLREWISSVCKGTPFSLESIRGAEARRLNSPSQDYQKIHRQAIEIAWRNSINKSVRRKPLPEAYLRWGRFRQRIDQNNLSVDYHQAITDLLHSIANSKSQDLVRVDHVEILLDQSEMRILWEYKPDASISDVEPNLQPYPVVVRSKLRSPTHDHRACPRSLISNKHIACNRHGEHFLETVQDHGVFVTTTYSEDNEEMRKRVKNAIEIASIGLWSRSTYKEDSQLRGTLVSCNVDDVPAKIHDRRKYSSSDSIWRNVVVLFDPNLPQFKFAEEVYDFSHQANINVALG